MDVKDLRFFVAAYEAGSFSGAAAMLGTVPSNVSLRIRNLEQLLGVPLFERHHRSVAPTAAAEILCRHARQVIAKLDETRLILVPPKAA